MCGCNRKATGRYFSEFGMQSSQQTKAQQVDHRNRVTINDVGPRDGLQNQSKILTPAERVQLVRTLLAAGMDHVEVGAFVSPKAVPAMAGTAEVLAGLPNTSDEVLTVLIPNLRGYELATAAGAKSVCMVLYGSDGMTRANAQISREQAETATAEILQQARADGVRVTSAIAVAFECPYDGPVAQSLIGDITRRFLDLGSDELCIADTIGAANPQQVRALAASLVDEHGADRLSFHFHDTRALGVANVFAALECGIRKFDTSIAGLGGCPFANQSAIFALKILCPRAIAIAPLRTTAKISAHSPTRVMKASIS